LKFKTIGKKTARISQGIVYRQRGAPLADVVEGLRAANRPGTFQRNHALRPILQFQNRRIKSQVSNHVRTLHWKCRSGLHWRRNLFEKTYWNTRIVYN